MAAETSVHEAPTPVLDGRDTATPAAQPVPAMAWALIGVAVASIWISVFVAGVYAPDFVSGSQHEHLKLVGGIDWIWANALGVPILGVFLTWLACTFVRSSFEQYRN